MIYLIYSVLSLIFVYILYRAYREGWDDGAQAILDDIRLHASKQFNKKLDEFILIRSKAKYDRS